MPCRRQPVHSKVSLALAGTWIDLVTDAQGRTGYTKVGEPSSRHIGDHARRFPPRAGEAMTAAGLWGRFLLGQDPDSQPIMAKSAALLLQKPPRWDSERGTIDSYYWFLGSCAMYQMGGKYWQRWLGALNRALVETQRDDGNCNGSWDAQGVWDEDGGRVYATALNTLALESAQRGARMAGR